MIPSQWVAYHRPGDCELVGYLTGSGDRTTALTVFGYPLAGPTGRAEARQVLESDGLRSLADPWLLRLDADRQVEVRILEAYLGRLIVVEAPYGFHSPDSRRHVLTVPADGLTRLAHR